MLRASLNLTGKAEMGADAVLATFQRKMVSSMHKWESIQMLVSTGVLRVIDNPFRNTGTQPTWKTLGSFLDVDFAVNDVLVW